MLYTFVTDGERIEYFPPIDANNSFIFRIIDFENDNLLGYLQVPGEKCFQSQSHLRVKMTQFEIQRTLINRLNGVIDNYPINYHVFG